MDRQDDGTLTDHDLYPFHEINVMQRTLAKASTDVTFAHRFYFVRGNNNDVNVCMLTCLLRQGETVIIVVAPIREHESITVILLWRIIDYIFLLIM